MAVHTLQCLNHVSMATGTFAGARPSGHRRVTASMADRQQTKFNAMATYNRRSHLPMASLGGTRLQRIHSGRDHFFGGASLQRLASHIGQPRFNALSRLASSPLRTSLDSRVVPAASAAIAARPVPQQAPVQVILARMRVPACAPAGRCPAGRFPVIDSQPSSLSAARLPLWRRC